MRTCTVTSSIREIGNWVITSFHFCGRASRPETLLIDSTTGDIEMARRVCNLAAAHNCAYIDAPVSGGVVGAKEHRLTFMVGARQKTHFDLALPIMNAMGARTVRTFAFEFLTLPL